MNIEKALRLKVSEILRLRRAYLQADRKRAAIAKAGNRIFEAFRKEFGASLKAKKSTRRPARKLKSETAGN